MSKEVGIILNCPNGVQVPPIVETKWELASVLVDVAFGRATPEQYMQVLARLEPEYVNLMRQLFAVCFGSPS